MLYLLDKDVRTVRWNGEPLHEATSAIVKETMNNDFILTVKYPISDTGIYKQIKEDMLIKCPTPVLGPQLFRIKKPVEENDYLEITAYHITDDIMQRSVKPVRVANQTCSIALSQMVQNAKTDLGDFSFTSDIQDHRTFNMSETENIYSVLLDGKHSIVGTWEGELVRDNFSLTVKKNRGENRGVVITTHKNLKSYQRSKNSQNVITRIHARSTFKPEGSENETTIKVTVDSPLINSYPYINEKEYENNNLKSVEDLKKWAQAKFTNEGIDKVSDSIKLEAYELDGQVVHLGDTVNLKSLKHNVDIFKKAIAYEYDGLKEEYLSLEFDDKPSFGGSGVSNGLSNVASTILGATYSAQEIAIERAARNADLAFEHQSNQLKKEVEDGIELIKAKSEENKRALSDEINRKFHDFSPEGFEEAKAKAEEALKKADTSEDLAKEAKLIANNSINELNAVREIATDNVVRFVEYKQDTEGRFANIASQMAGKVNEVDFQRVKETSQLYERILGGAENDVSNNVSRMVLTSQVFQTEVGKYVTDDNNLIVNSLTMGTNTLANATRDGVNVSVSDGVFTIKAQGLTSYNFSGFTLPIYVKKIYQGETYTLGFKYRILSKLDSVFAFNIKNHGLNKILLNADIGEPTSQASDEWQEFQKTFTVTEDFAFGEERSYPFYIYLAKNGWIEFKEPILVRGSRTGPYKPSQFDDAYKTTDEAKGLATDAQTRAIQIAQGLEATRTQVTQLAGSYAIQNLNSAGDIINGINLGANGNNRIIGKATHITGDTLIDNAVIKSAMIDKLKTANFEAGSVTTNILGAEAVTAEKVKFDTAFIQRLVSQQAFVDELFAKQATITKIQSVDFTANHIKGGVLSGLNGNATFDLNNGQIRMQSSPTSWKTTWDPNGIAFRGPGNDVWGAMGGSSGGGVGIYMRGDHAFSVVVGHSDTGNSKNYYTPFLVRYGHGTWLQFSPGGPNYNLLLLFNDIYRNIEQLHKVKATSENYRWTTIGPLK
ncbi:phage tail spike protein [Streptococcus sp. V728]|uniref:phage tail spike protein n=1 Tax=Streptococcus sp. V728 TaxID=3455700 RepID=UPI003F913110